MRYTFVRSNLMKLLMLPVYALIGPIALVFPRNPKAWVFGRKTGVGDGPLAVLDMLRNKRTDIRVTWIAQDQADQDLAMQYGIEAYRRNTIKGLLATLRAKYIVVTHGLGDVNRVAAPGAFIIQLWHGSPFKKIYLDAPASHKTGSKPVDLFAGYLLTGMYKLTARLVKVYVAASPLLVPRYASAFKVHPRKIRVTGDPRCDILHYGNDPKEISNARARLQSLWGISLPSRLVIYAPTWRDGRENPGLPNREELAALQKMAERMDILFVIRSHPWGHGLDELQPDYASRIQFLPSSQLNDVNQVLSAFDILISDYSAIIMDYSILDRPVIFFAPDIEEHRRNRGFYEDFEIFTGGRWSVNWTEVVDNIQNILTDDGVRQEVVETATRQIRSRYQSYSDGKNTVRLLEELGVSLS